MLNSYNVTLYLNNTKLPQSAPIEQFPVVSVGVHHDSVLQDDTVSSTSPEERGREHVAEMVLPQIQSELTTFITN